MDRHFEVIAIVGAQTTAWLNRSAEADFSLPLSIATPRISSESPHPTNTIRPLAVADNWGPTNSTGDALAFMLAAHAPGAPGDNGGGSDWSSITHFSGNGIQTNDDLWWFNGADPSKYSVITSLWATNYPTYYGTYVWTVTSGTAIVDFHNGSDTYTATNNNQVGLVSTSWSTGNMDVGIEVKWNGTLIGTATLTVRRPRSLEHLSDVDQAGPGGGGWDSFIHYKILDQFGNQLPRRVEINEKFTTADMTDYAGENWPQSAEGSATVNPADFYDHMGAHLVDGQNPVPQNPQSPLGTVKIDHWTQEWYVGSLQIGEGVLVQTNTFQRFRDHGRHEGATAPL